MKTLEGVYDEEINVYQYPIVHASILDRKIKEKDREIDQDFDEREVLESEEFTERKAKKKPKKKKKKKA